MPERYDNDFFDYTDRAASRSARVVVPLLRTMVSVESVIDVGCGRGAWLVAWRDTGVTDVFGVDGNVVDEASLLIESSRFASHDLNVAIHRDRRFDLAQSLEVAEHLRPDSAQRLVTSLVGLADVVLFSAAVPGQGGAHHINERPLEYWRGLFANYDYQAFDALRPKLSATSGVEPWYRYNALLYANAKGATRLSETALARKVDPRARVADGGNFRWRLRRTLLRPLPVSIVSWMATIQARALNR